jgi:hypothetical protein
MKTPAILGVFLLFSSQLFSQDYSTFGYRTTDIGGSFEWYPSGTVYGLHAAFNSRQHHSFHFKLGYNITNRKEGEVNDIEKGNGWGGTLGYRYYIRPFPHKFFIGARSDIWHKNIDWNKETQSGTSKTWTVVPAFEIGYTFWINDQAFLTPSISNGAEINLKTDGQKVGQGFITIIGISTGVRL